MKKDEFLSSKSVADVVSEFPDAVLLFFVFSLVHLRLRLVLVVQSCEEIQLRSIKISNVDGARLCIAVSGLRKRDGHRCVFKPYHMEDFCVPGNGCDYA